MTSNAGHVFVSHSSDNRQLAVELAGFLEGKGIRVWIAPRDVRPGMDYSEELQKAIETSAAFVVLVTEMANKSPYVRAETEMAFSSHKPIFPVRTTEIQPAAGLAFFLKIRHWTDAFGNQRLDNLDRLVRELQAHSAPAAAAAAAAASAGAAAPTPAPPPPPPPPPPAAASFGAAPASSGFGAASAAAVAAPGAPALLPADAGEEEKWRVAIGPKADHYLARWKAMAARNSAIGWNWSAALASLFWFAYRKMWVPMAVLIGVNLVLSMISAGGPDAWRLSLVLSIGLSFVTGGFGNHFYRKHVARLVAETAGLDRAAQLQTLKQRGGISMPALMISLVILGLIILLTILAVIGAQQQQASDAMNQFNAQYFPDQPAQQGDKPPADPNDPYYQQEGY